MAQEAPTGWAGGWFAGAQYGRQNEGFNDTIPGSNGSIPNDVEASIDTTGTFSVDWLSNKPMTGVIHGCPRYSNCSAKIRAPALVETSCASQLIAVNYTQLINATTMHTMAYAPPLNTIGFASSTNLVLREYEKINLLTAYSRVQDCAGTLNLTTCTLEAAIGEYVVFISGDTLTVDPGKPTILAMANNTRVSHVINPSVGNYYSTLGGIVAQMQLNTQSYVWNYYEDGDHFTRQDGASNFAESYISYDAVNQDCPSFLDPRDELLQRLNYLMFSTGAFAAKDPTPSWIEARMDPGLPLHKNITGTLVGSHNVFHTDLRWWLGAALIEIICIALVLPTYVGWWRLGRPVSFSPLEVAKAFEAPIFKDCNSNSSGPDLAKSVGNLRVQYGVTRSGLKPEGAVQNKRPKLAFAPSYLVERPQDGARYDV